MEDQRLENRSEESQTGETDHTDRHVARLDGGVEQDPVQPEQSPVPGDLKELLQTDLRESDEQNKHGCREEQPVPCQRGLIERDQLAEQPREPSQQHAQMQLKKSRPKISISHSLKMRANILIFLRTPTPPVSIWDSE